jgi:8-oxo-dGTP pyrophosphatase MutT (NUDIX family)
VVVIGLANGISRAYFGDRSRMKWLCNRIFWFFAKPPRTLYLFVFRPKRHAVKILIKCGDSFLFVRPTYAHRQWTLPGGGVNRGETFVQAAMRELKEETGITVDNLIEIGDYESRLHYARDTVRCFLATANRQDVKIDGVEIGEAAWFRLDQLPMNRTPRVDKIIDLYKQHLVHN